MVVNGQILINTLLVAFDLSGTFVFALSGATAAVKHRLDLFGVLVLSFAAGNSGGIARDVMIGAIPPAAINDWRYLAVCIVAGITTFFWYRIIDRLSSPVLVFDAAGLALFAGPHHRCGYQFCNRHQETNALAICLRGHQRPLLCRTRQASITRMAVLSQAQELIVWTSCSAHFSIRTGCFGAERGIADQFHHRPLDCAKV
jgi:Glycine transporter